MRASSPSRSEDIPHRFEDYDFRLGLWCESTGCGRRFQRGKRLCIIGIVANSLALGNDDGDFAFASLNAFGRGADWAFSPQVDADAETVHRLSAVFAKQMPLLLKKGGR